jgi:ABC-type Mn2+/Zn2+ transport system ATPase subunit
LKRRKTISGESLPAMIEMINVSKAYEENPHALFDITFKVEKGKHLSFGPNGAGKTTLLKLSRNCRLPARSGQRV